MDRETAQQVGEIFRVLYGEEYIYPYVYEPELLVGEIDKGNLLAVLASDRQGKSAGYVALAKSTTNPRLWEERSLVVDPMYQYTNLSSVLANYFINMSVCQRVAIDCMFAEAVCHHYFTQIVCVKAGWVSCALVLDALDKSIFKDHQQEKGRVASLQLYWEINEQPEIVYLPVEYAHILKQLAVPLKPRTFRISKMELPNEGTTVWQEQYNPANQSWKVIIQEIGTDWAVFLTEILSQAIERKAISVQIILNAACPYLGAAVKLLRDRGFFLGGLVPHGFGTDGLLMQKVLRKEPDYEGIKLYDKTAKELLAFIRTDRENVRRLEEE